MSGKQIKINGQEYYAGPSLGSGARASVYRAVLQGVPPPADVVIKQAIDASSNAALQDEIDALRKLNHKEIADAGYSSSYLPIADSAPDVDTARHNIRERLRVARQTEDKRRIIMLLDAGYDENKNPWIVQEFAPPQFVPSPVRNMFDEARVVSFVTELARAMELVHRQNMALQDFDPTSGKVDRLRFELYPIPNFKIIDWNISGGRDMQEKDLEYLGHYLYWFLLPDPPHKQAPGALDLARLERVSPTSRQIIESLRSKGYQEISRVVDDLSRWCDDLRLAVRLADKPDDAQARSMLDGLDQQRRQRIEHQLAQASGARPYSQSPRGQAAPTQTQELPSQLDGILKVLQREHSLVPRRVEELHTLCQHSDENVWNAAFIYAQIVEVLQGIGNDAAKKHEMGPLFYELGRAIYQCKWEVAEEQMGKLLGPIGEERLQPLRELLDERKKIKDREIARKKNDELFNPAPKNPNETRDPLASLM